MQTTTVLIKFMSLIQPTVVGCMLMSWIYCSSRHSRLYADDYSLDKVYELDTADCSRLYADDYSPLLASVMGAAYCMVTRV